MERRQGRWPRIDRAFAAGLLALAAIASAQVHAREKAVVMVYGGETRTPAYLTFGAEFKHGLGDPKDVQFYEEYLDNARFPDHGHEQLLADYLRDRYAGKQVDVVGALDPVALRFLARHQARSFPGAAVVYSGISRGTLAQVPLPPNFIGIPNSLDASQTVGMALALRPQAREVVVVTGVAELDRDWESAIRAAPRPPGIGIRVLSGQPIEMIERELAALGPEAVVVLGTFRIDGAGRPFSGGMAVLDRLKKVSKAPIFGVYNNGVGRGAVGTYSVSMETIARQGAEVARQLLDGLPVNAVRVPGPSAPVPVADWRELRRWGIDESLLPPGTELLFRQPSFWEQYRPHMLAVAVLLALETALVAGLLLQRRQRRKVEEQLRQNQQSMQLAANAAGLVLWTWDAGHDKIWRSDGSHEREGMLPGGTGTLAGLLAVIHEEDRESFQRAIDRAIRIDGIFESEYRIAAADGTTRWFAGRGRTEQVDGALRLRGITLDITRRKFAEMDAQQQRSELAHLSRVTMLGELSGSVAHELNQPLMSILGNAQAARMLVGRDPVDLVEIAAILDDIIEDDKRAGEIIWGMRRMLKKEEVQHGLLQLNELVPDVLRLMRGDLMNRGVAVDVALAPEAPAVRGDRMQLQQVLLNLILNASDAMAANEKGDRILEIRTAVAGRSVQVTVSDCGEGIPPASLDGVFTPFFTTKKQGLGLGLSVCNSIITSHGGQLSAANNPGRGATFTFVLRAEETVFA